MTMRAKSDGRKVYSHKGSLVTCYEGTFFGPPANKESKILTEKEVTIKVLEKSGGKKRVAVTQKVGNKNVTENWSEKPKDKLFEKRAAST